MMVMYPQHSCWVHAEPAIITIFILFWRYCRNCRRHTYSWWCTHNMVARSSTPELRELPSHGSEVDFLRELAEKEPPHAAFIASDVSGLKYFTTTSIKYCANYISRWERATLWCLSSCEPGQSYTHLKYSFQKFTYVALIAIDISYLIILNKSYTQTWYSFKIFTNSEFIFSASAMGHCMLSILCVLPSSL